jgi:hypothetical protein
MGITANVKAVGVKRPDFGKSGQKIKVLANVVPIDIPRGFVYHYDGRFNFNVTYAVLTIFLPVGWLSPLFGCRLRLDPLLLAFTPYKPARVAFVLLKELQVEKNDIFTPKSAFDGEKNLYSIKRLNLDPDHPEADSKTVCAYLLLAIGSLIYSTIVYQINRTREPEAPHCGDRDQTGREGQS